MGIYMVFSYADDSWDLQNIQNQIIVQEVTNTKNQLNTYPKLEVRRRQNGQP
jgi:hypothetical protein